VGWLAIAGIPPLSGFFAKDQVLAAASHSGRTAAWLVALFAAFGIIGTRIALAAPDRFGTLLAAGITVWVVGQAVINIGGVVGLLPVSGIPLPYISFGGSALVFTMAAAGLLGSVARRAS